MKSEVNNYIFGGNDKYLLTQRIDNFFSKHPEEKKIFWKPEINGKSRYAFSISKEAFNRAKRYTDTSDLYYHTKKIDEKLSFKADNSKKINLFLQKHDYKLIYKQNITSSINASVFFQKKNDKYYGLILDKNIIALENILGNLAIEQSYDEYPILNVKFVKLTNNENSEIYYNIEYRIKSDYYNSELRYTWFDIASQVDLSMAIKKKNREIYREINTKFRNKNKEFRIGLQQSKNNSKINLFFDLKLNNIFNKKLYNSSVSLGLNNYSIAENNLSLKYLRKKSLDSFWQRNMQFK
ncbi:hypothetical protein N9832_05140 [Amylibacter sp.]|nr:hypothetical protein [Amylibacter sp.]